MDEQRKEVQPISDLLKKAKAIAALESGVTVFLERVEENVEEWSVGWCENSFGWEQRAFTEMRVRTIQGNNPIDALAEAADELKLTPDPSILSGGVQLTEEEKAIVATVRRVVGEAGYPNLAEELEETIDRLTGGGAS